MNRNALFAAALAAGCGSAKPCPTPAAVAAKSPTCDLVSCVLTEHQGACCYKLEHPVWAAFDERMVTIAERANHCAAVSGYDGYFPVAVTYDARGTVTDVGKPKGFDGTLDAPTLACISALVRDVQLPPSPAGDTLTYPFMLHP